MASKSRALSPIPAGKGDALPLGKVLIPGGSAMTFFTETDLPWQYLRSHRRIHLYVIPAKKDWTLIVSKNTGRR